MKCWLASFPRSGNTYFRNILYYVYGVESSTWHKESRYPVDKNYDQFDFVKTHLLPSELEPNDSTIPAIYLVRDGRDALVSIAHHRSDIVQPGSDFSQNLNEAIIAAGGSFFGGWSHNVNAWLQRANIVIKFEDLIEDPKQVFQRVETLIDLPAPNWCKLPNFEELKFGKPKYGGQTTSKKINISPEEFSDKFFRKGKSGGWKGDMSSAHLDLFWHFHSDVMDRMGYSGSPVNIPQNRLLDSVAIHKLGAQNHVIHQNDNQGNPIRILIDGNILSSTDYPSAKRNFIYFLKGLEDVTVVGNQKYFFDILIDGKFISLHSFINLIKSKKDDPQIIIRTLFFVKQTLSVILPDKFFFALARAFRNAVGGKSFFESQKHINELSENDKNNDIKQSLKTHAENYDLYHIPFAGRSCKLNNFPLKTVMTVHSLNFGTDREQNKGSSDFFCIDADFFITTSSVISNQLHESFKIEKEKIFCVTHTAEKDLFYKSTRKSYVDRTLKKYSVNEIKYFLCESNDHDSEKDFLTVLQGFERFKKENPSASVILIILGSRQKINKRTLTEIDGIADVIFSGRVEETDLKILYSNAVAFIHYRSGFNTTFSILEALFCKTPVIYCNIYPADKSIEGDMIIELCDTETIAEKMELFYSNQHLRRKHVHKSYKKTLEFTLRRTLSETLKVYENITSM